MRDKALGELIYHTLVANGLDQYEKQLGSGAFGNVFQIKGEGVFDGKELALKLIPQDPNYQCRHAITNSSSAQSNSYGETLSSVTSNYSGSESFSDRIQTTWSESSTIDDSSLYSWPSTSSSEVETKTNSIFNTIFTGTWSISRVTHDGVIGDGVALNFPSDSSLSFAHGVLLFDGQKVQYVEKIDPDLHQGNVIVGVISPAVQGGTLINRARTLPLDAEAVKGFGKSLALAIRELHQVGYVHRDLHMNNILVLDEKEHSYGLKLIDFGLAGKTSEVSVNDDWEDFKGIMGRLQKLSENSLDPKLKHLLNDMTSPLASGIFTYNDEEKLLQHPYFA